MCVCRNHEGHPLHISSRLIRKILHTCGFPAAAAIASSHKEQRASSFNTYYVPTYLGREVLAGCGAENVAKFGGHHQHMSPRIQKREYTTPPPFSLEWMNESKKCQARCVLWRQTKFFFLLQCISMTPLLFDTHKNSDEIYYKGAPIGSKKWWCATGLGRNL